jgi:hypothetical protein
MKMVMAIFTFILLMTIVIFASIHYSRPANEDWTVMIYMAGDNSLSNIVDQNLNAMMKVGSNELVDIVALVDKSGNQDAKLYHIEKGKLNELAMTSIYISGLNEIDTGNPETLSTFGEFVIDKYPSNHYLLIMWGHGNGWQGLASDKDGSSLTMTEFRSALERIVKKDMGKKLDIIGFDACAMATVEGFYEVSEYSDILVASQKKEPDAGWPYENILKGI